jgi:hypothetical protein
MLFHIACRLGLLITSTKNTHQHRTHTAKRAGHSMVHRSAAIEKMGGRDILKHQKLTNNDVLKGTVDNVCTLVDSLKKCVPEDGRVRLKRVGKHRSICSLVTFEIF